jgi:hypothetical protein
MPTEDKLKSHECTTNPQKGLRSCRGNPHNMTSKQKYRKILFFRFHTLPAQEHPNNRGYITINGRAVRRAQICSPSNDLA